MCVHVRGPSTDGVCRSVLELLVCWATSCLALARPPAFRSPVVCVAFSPLPLDMARLLLLPTVVAGPSPTPPPQCRSCQQPCVAFPAIRPGARHPALAPLTAPPPPSQAHGVAPHTQACGHQRCCDGQLGPSMCVACPPRRRVAWRGAARVFFFFLRGTHDAGWRAVRPPRCVACPFWGRRAAPLQAAAHRSHGRQRNCCPSTAPVAENETCHEVTQRKVTIPRARKTHGTATGAARLVRGRGVPCPGESSRVPSPLSLVIRNGLGDWRPPTQPLLTLPHAADSGAAPRCPPTRPPGHAVTAR